MASDSAPSDALELLRRMWANMGFALPGMVTPTLDVDELERRITDLKAVEGWLKMNLGMLQMTIQGLEIQRATLVAVRAMSQPNTSEESESGANPFAGHLWQWAFPKAAEESATTEAPAEGAARRPGR